MPIHSVTQGDCINSIADQYGQLWEKIWNHGENAELKRLRKDPNVLNPGDELFIPDLETKQVGRAVDQRHKFRRKGVPVRFKIRLMDGDKPRANLPCKLEIDGILSNATTSEDGYIEAYISASAVRGRILAGEGTTQDVYDIGFGTLDPISTTEGVSKRLIDLGYAAGDNFQEAVSAFQKSQQLPITGEVDEATRNSLQKVFGQ